MLQNYTKIYNKNIKAKNHILNEKIWFNSKFI